MQGKAGWEREWELGGVGRGEREGRRRGSGPRGKGLLTERRDRAGSLPFLGQGISLGFFVGRGFPSLVACAALLLLLLPPRRHRAVLATVSPGRCDGQTRCLGPPTTPVKRLRQPELKNNYIGGLYSFVEAWWGAVRATEVVQAADRYPGISWAAPPYSPPKWGHPY